MKKVYSCIIIILLSFMFYSCKGDSCSTQEGIDAVTGASGKYYLRKNMLEGKELMKLLRNPLSSPSTVFVISTVQCGGMANSAIVMPYAIDETTLMIVIADNNTRSNIIKNKYATALIRTTDPSKKTPKLDPYGNVGSRMLLKHIDDEKLQKKLYEANKAAAAKYMAQSYKDCIFLKIVKVYPLG